MFYFFILSNFKPAITGHTWQEGARRIPLNLIEYYIWYMYAENNCAEVVLNKQRCLLRGYFFQIRRSWKSGGHRFVFVCVCVKNIGVSTWNKQEIIGWLYLCSMTIPNPHANYQRYAQWGLHYWFMITLQFRGGVIQILIIKYRGHKILPRYLWKVMNLHSKVWWPHNSFV